MKSPARFTASSRILLAFLSLLLPSAGLSQEDRPQAIAGAIMPRYSLCVDDPGAHAAGDVRAQVAEMRLADGATIVGRTRTGLRLLAIADGGRVIDYAVVDADGRTDTTLSTLAVSTTGDDCNPCCWKCGKDAGGTVHCWQIECPVIVADTGGGGD
jgi:hypothetical protein